MDHRFENPPELCHNHESGPLLQLEREWYKCRFEKRRLAETVAEIRCVHRDNGGRKDQCKASQE